MASCFCVLLSYSLAFARSSLFSFCDFFPFPGPSKYPVLSSCLGLRIGAGKIIGSLQLSIITCTNQFLSKLATMAFHPAYYTAFVRKSHYYRNVIVSFIGRTKGNPSPTSTSVSDIEATSSNRIGHTRDFIRDQVSGPMENDTEIKSKTPNSIKISP